MCEAIVRECDGIDLGDEWLNKRSELLIAALAKDMQTSINANCETGAETQAAYRLFDNENVTPAKILRPHRDATVRRIRGLAVALIVQDTIELDREAAGATSLKVRAAVTPSACR